jgi:hypothetical protein
VIVHDEGVYLGELHGQLKAASHGHCSHKAPSQRTEMRQRMSPSGCTDVIPLFYPPS